MKPVLALAPALILLAACQKTEPSAPPASPATASTASIATPATVAAATTAAAPPATFTVEPATLPECDHTPVVATLTWDASTAIGNGHVGIDVAAAEGQPLQPFSRGKPAADVQQTGKWVRAGAVFVLTSLPDGRELARTSVAATPCTAN